MAGVAMTISMKDHGIEKLLNRIQKQMHNLTPVMNIVGQIVRTSIVRNFEKEGRPKRWKKHSKMTEKQRGSGAAILRKENHLMNSIHSKAHKDKAVIGTNIAYAAVHQFGAKKGKFGTVQAKVREHVRRRLDGGKTTVKAHTRKMELPWGDIPARPFMMVQDEDWEEIRESLMDYLLKRHKG